MNPNNKLFIFFLEEQGVGGKPTSTSTPEQLAIYRAYWRQFVEIRQILGTCIQCNRKHRPGEQRCALHRNKNRVRCLIWAQKNKNRLKEQYRYRVNSKICHRNTNHGSVYNGHVVCKDCYEKSRKK